MSIKKRAHVDEIMSKQIHSVSLQHSIKDVENIMHENCIRHVPVVSGDHLLGLISQTDLERISFVELGDDQNVKANIFNAYSIEQVMTKNLNSVRSDDTIKDAAEIMSLGAYHSLPVVDDNKLVGILTTTDLIDYLLDQY
jgi:CBS domain-containing protein